jgi:uncharacterized protein
MRLTGISRLADTPAAARESGHRPHTLALSYYRYRNLLQTSLARVYSNFLVYSASDVANFLACHHIATLERACAAGEIKRPHFDDPSVEVLQKLGLEHEQLYLKHLRETRGLSVTEVPEHGEEAAAATLEAVQRGDPAIYQATFVSGPWRGRADFLLRVDTRSRLGEWSYEAVDTKLARSTKAGAIIQLCFYSDLLAQIQGIEPANMHVVLGGNCEGERFPVQRYIAYFRWIRKQYEEAWETHPPTYPEPVEHCQVCAWDQVCDQQRHRDDHLSLVAGISRNQRRELERRSVNTVVGLANLNLPVSPSIRRVSKAALSRIHEQARIQVQGREEHRVCHELLEPVEAGKGLTILPAPSPGDLFLDLEANPYVFDDGLEYLFGRVARSEKNDLEYQAEWAFDRPGEKAAFENLIAEITRRREHDPGMHVYHYAPYEPTALKRLAGRHATCVEELDQLLRAEVFVDLYRAARQGLRASVESYSIKRLEPLYGFTREVALRDANLALSNYEAALALGIRRDRQSEFLRIIEGYNRDDCFSTMRLREWLEGCRAELEQTTAEPLPRPEAKPGAPNEKLAEEIKEAAAVRDRLLEDLPPDELQWNAEARARYLLAHMLEYHRREDKSLWWEYFRLCRLSDEELQEDRNAIGGLEYKGAAGKVKMSLIHRYRFPPQDFDIRVGDEVRNPKTGENPGEVVALDEENGTIDLKRSATSGVTHPTALIPYEWVNPKPLPGSLLRLGKWVAENGLLAEGPNRAARELLLRQPPAALRENIREVIDENCTLTAEARKLVLTLATQPGVLPVQGPPGSGKTFTAAIMILELVKQGKRVGVTAVSHKVISHLLDELCAIASERGVWLRVMQKPKEGQEGCKAAPVKLAGNGDVETALANGDVEVVAGTAWLWARPEMANAVDVLFVDEAGQMSLAHTLAIAQAATSLVLLGDPQQLEQPQRGVHPPGADVSALGHLLGGNKTISSEQGLFLTETRRMHPDICSFISEAFYEGRLLPRPENSEQRIHCKGQLGATGLRFVPVEHFGNQSESSEEVEAVLGLVNSLIREGASWTDKKGHTKLLAPSNFMVVAPYNAQVNALRIMLPEGVQVGTVDKFQGREAPIVIYSMATSTPEDAPRGMEFLYSLNRLNVAISRAQCMAVLVASPALFHVQCRSPRQIELANAFCRYLELAQVERPVLRPGESAAPLANAAQ